MEKISGVGVKLTSEWNNLKYFEFTEITFSDE